MPDINKDKSLLIRCTCHGHILEIERDDEFGEYYVFIWGNHIQFHTFKDKLKLIWDLIRNRNVLNSDVVITKEDAVKLVKFLNKKPNKK